MPDSEIMFLSDEEIPSFTSEVAEIETGIEELEFQQFTGENAESVEPQEPTEEIGSLIINKSLICNVWHTECDVMGDQYWVRDEISNPQGIRSKEGHRIDHCGAKDSWYVYLDEYGSPYAMLEMKAGSTNDLIPLPATFYTDSTYTELRDPATIEVGERIYWTTENRGQVWHHTGVTRLDVPTFEFIINGQSYFLQDGDTLTIENLPVGEYTIIEKYSAEYIINDVNVPFVVDQEGSVVVTVNVNNEAETIVNFENRPKNMPDPAIVPEPVIPNTPTPVPTETPIPTDTPTPTPTEMPTPTPTNTPTPTETPTPTPTEIPTPIPTETPTPTPTPTSTPIPTSTETPTQVPIETPTPTETPTPMPTSMPTETPTPTPTETSIPTDTPTPTETLTPTNAPTSTETPTPIITPEPMPTNIPIGNLTITKYLKLNTGEYLIAKEAEYYVALFTDDTHSEIASEILTLSYNNSYIASITFEDLVLNENYYWAEVDEYGNVVEDIEDFMIVDYTDGNEVVLDDENIEIFFSNIYNTLPEGYYIFTPTPTLKPTIIPSPTITLIPTKIPTFTPIPTNPIIITSTPEVSIIPTQEQEIIIPDQKKPVQTGDNTPITALILLLIISGGIFIFTIRKKK